MNILITNGQLDLMSFFVGFSNFGKIQVAHVKGGSVAGAKKGASCVQKANSSSRLANCKPS